MRIVPTGRPAETAGAAGGLAVLIAAVADHNTLAAFAALVGVIPAAVTYLVAHGGVRGVVASIWGGKS